MCKVWSKGELLMMFLCVCVCVCVCVDPTAGPSASDQSTWYLDESTLSDNIKKTLHKFCGPSPVVFRYTLPIFLNGP